MKNRIKAFAALLTLSLVCIFCFAACGPKKYDNGYMLQFGSGSWEYSDKVTFNLGKAKGSKDLNGYLEKNKRMVKVKYEQIYSAAPTMSVKILLDTEILDKTFDDEELNGFILETKALMQDEKAWDKADVFNRAAIRFLGLSGIVLSSGVKGELYKDYNYLSFEKQESVSTPYYADEWELLLEKSQSPLVKSMVFDWQKFKKVNESSEDPNGYWPIDTDNFKYYLYLGENDGECDVETYLHRAEESYPYLIACGFSVNDDIFDKDMTFEKPEEAAFVEELRAMKAEGADIKTLRIKVLEFLELEGHFVYYYQGVYAKENGVEVYTEAGSFESYGNDNLFEKFSKIWEHRDSRLIAAASVGKAIPDFIEAYA